MYGHGDVEPSLLRNDTVDLVEVGTFPQIPLGIYRSLSKLTAASVTLPPLSCCRTRDDFQNSKILKQTEELISRAKPADSAGDCGGLLLSSDEEGNGARGP